MEINLGIQLGALHQQLGIARDARITVEHTPTGDLVINDLSAEKQYKVSLNPPRATRAPVVVPQWTKEILTAPDDTLKKRWKETEGWNGQRAAIFSELTCRGVRVLDIDLGLEG